MTWREPKDHTTDCYFFLINTKGVCEKNRHKISYPSVPSAIRPTLHSDELPIPVLNRLSPAEEEGSNIDQESDHETQEIFADSEDSSYVTPESSTPQQSSQP